MSIKLTHLQPGERFVAKGVNVCAPNGPRLYRAILSGIGSPVYSAGSVAETVALILTAFAHADEHTQQRLLLAVSEMEPTE